MVDDKPTSRPGHRFVQHKNRARSAPVHLKAAQVTAVRDSPLSNSFSGLMSLGLLIRFIHSLCSQYNHTFRERRLILSSMA
jgi:hypothetical protein